MGLCIWSELLQHVCKSAGPHSTFRDDGRGGKGSWSCKKEEGGGLSHLTVAAYVRWSQQQWKGTVANAGRVHCQGP